MSCDKKCVRTTVAVIGVLFVLIALLALLAGVGASTSPELMLLGINKSVAHSLVGSGFVMLLTAGLGWTAAATKNEPLSFFVS